MTLKQWQQALADVCHNSRKSKSIDTILNNCIDNAGNSSERLEVYRNHYIGGMLSALEQTFPLLIRLLGRDYFRQCGRAFLTQSSHQYPADLNQLGAFLPHFLRHLQRDKDELTPYPWLADLAQLEYYQHSAYYAADDDPFDFSLLQQVFEQPQKLYFDLSHSFYLLHSRWPITDIHDDISASNLRNIYPEMSQSIVILRLSNKLQIHSINSQQTKLLTNILRRQNLQQLLMHCPAAEQLLPALISSGWICSFSVTHEFSENNTGYV